MKIKQLRIENFYSFRDATIDFSSYEGITVIKGKNKDTGGSNGAGKSVLVEAVFFALTGKTIRKSTEDTLVNNKAKRKCMVEIELNNDIRIRRYKKPTKLEFFIGKEDLTQESVTATQELINETLNINHKVLLASMFFGQASTVSFLDCSADDKRVIIRNFLNLDEMFKMRDRIKSHKSQFYQEMKKQDAIILEHQSTISDINNKVALINKAKEQHKDYPLDLNLQDIIREERSRSEIRYEISQQNRSVDSMLERVSLLKEELNIPLEDRRCPDCEQVLTNRTDTKIEKEIDAVSLVISETRNSVKDQEASIPEVKISSSEYSSFLEYRDLCRDSSNYLSLKDTLKEKINKAEGVKVENKTSYEVMRFWEKAFSEHGIVKYIIRNILDYFNKRSNYYLSYLSENKYFVEFDEELSEKIETNGSIIPYISLSGGEKRKINLAVLLALKDLLLFTDKHQCNLLFFDEVAENLDEEGVQGLYNLLQEIKKDKTVFVITHNKYLKTLLDSSPRLSIIKELGTSNILEK